MPDEVRASLVREFHPSQRMVSPNEIADAVAWAAAPDGACATGLVIPVHGGWSARCESGKAGHLISVVGVLLPAGGPALVRLRHFAGENILPARPPVEIDP